MKALLIYLALGAVMQEGTSPDLSHPWSLAECTEWALENNLTVASQKLNEENKMISENTARMSWLPSVSGSVGESMNFGRGLGGNNTYEYGNSSSTNFSLGANMTLFDGLATPRRMELAKLNLEAATEDLAKAREDIRIQVAQAYVQILYDYEIHEVAQRQVEIDSLQVVRLEGLLANGKASAAELSQQKATLSQSRLTQVQALNNIRSAHLTLMQLLELPFSEEFRVVRPSVTMEDIRIGNPDDIYLDALGLRPSVKAEEIRLRSAAKEVEIAKAAYYPSLGLSGGLGTNYYSSFATQGFMDQLSNNFSQYLGLTLSIPIFDKFSTRNQVRSAQLQYRSQEVQLQRARNSLYKEIQTAWNGAVAARAKWEASSEAAVAAEDAFKLTQAKYENGKATLTEFHEALNRLTKARSDSVQATYEYIYQTALVEFYRGGALSL